MKLIFRKLSRLLVIIAIVAVNILFFVYSKLKPDNFDLNNFGISYENIFTNHKIWTILTNMWVHVDFAHLFMNMAGLIVIGRPAVYKYGIIPVLLIYIITGVIGGFIQILIKKGNLLAIGASNAIFGLYGSTGFWKDFLPWTTLVIQICFAIAMEVVIYNQMNLGPISFMKNIGWWGHIISLILGIILNKSGFMDFIAKKQSLF